MLEASARTRARAGWLPATLPLALLSLPREIGKHPETGEPDFATDADGNLVKDLILVGMGVLSLVTTRQALREANGFNWFPIQEVAYLFAGIFMTIVPALKILQAGEHLNR